MQRSKSCAFSASMCSRTVASRSFRRALGVKLRGAFTSALSKAQARLGLPHGAVAHKVGPGSRGPQPLAGSWLLIVLRLRLVGVEELLVAAVARPLNVNGPPLEQTSPGLAPPAAGGAAA